MNKTKIICTIGPVTESIEMLEKLHDAGMNIARLNFSHGEHAMHLKIINKIKNLNKKLKYPIGILLDTKGPEIRTSNPDMVLTKDQIVHVSVDKSVTGPSPIIHVEYPDLLKTLKVGDKIKIDSGLINLLVLEKKKQTMVCKVLDGGKMKNKRHVNLPGVHVNLPSVTEADKRDILFGLENGIDFIAASFVREAKDVMELKQLCGRKHGHVKIIAKIEEQEGVRNIDSIIDAADGIMVARGDLGIEIDVEEVPSVQRMIVTKCAEKGKRVIVATQMLESMIENPMPTRAEVTDVSHAVYQEVDAIMLSGETSVGKYAVECVQQMSKIARKTESLPGNRLAEFLMKTSQRQILADSAVRLSDFLNAKGIVILTQTGTTADLVTNCRPKNSLIYAFTFLQETYRSLTLNRGVVPFLVKFQKNPQAALGQAFQILRDQMGFKPGEMIVLLSDMMENGDRIEVLHVRPIPAK